MNKLGTALLTASALLVAGTASAELPDWTYVQAGYFQADSIGDDQTDAFTLDGSLGFLDVWHVQVGYINGSLGIGSLNNDFDGYVITAGAHPAISQNSQLVVDGIYFDDTYDVIDDRNINRDGYGVGVGFRSNVTDKVEASVMGYWTYENIDRGPTDLCSDSSDSCDATNVSIEFAGRYNWTKNFSTGAALNIGDARLLGSADSMNLDVRYTFAGFSL